MCFQFEGQAGEEFQEQASQLCSQHSQAVELIKNKKRKDPRFAQIIQVHTHTHTHTLICCGFAHNKLLLLAQECEASPHCRRLQLKDLLVSEMHRITKYPLLLDKIIKHTEGENLGNNFQMMLSKRANLQRFVGPNLSFSPCSWCTRPPLAAASSGLLQRDPADHQRSCQGDRAPATAEPIPAQAGRCPAVQGGHTVDWDPPAPQVHAAFIEIQPSFFYLVSQNLDLSTKRMIHEGPLTWKVSKDKQLGKKFELRKPLFLNYYVKIFFFASFLAVNWVMFFFTPSIRDPSPAAGRLPGSPSERPRRPTDAEVPLPLAGRRRNRQRRQQDLLQPSGETGLSAGSLRRHR